jgi:hypothetical protein
MLRRMAIPPAWQESTNRAELSGVVRFLRYKKEKSRATGKSTKLVMRERE